MGTFLVLMIAGMVAIVNLTTCKTTNNSETLVSSDPDRPPHTPFSQMNYPAADEQLGERLYPDEVENARTIAALLEKNIRERYGNGRHLRDAHPKAHGCPKAEFRVYPNIPPELRHGVFEPGKTYEAVVRFSNGNGDPTIPDIEGDARGMAIKLFGVQGQKLLDVERQAQTQDFIMINHPVFMIDDPAEYVDLVANVGSSNIFSKIQVLESLGFRGLPIVRALRKIKITSPLNTRYFSMTPYQLGVGPNRRAIKFSAKPCRPNTAQLPQNPHPDFLRKRLASRLATGTGCFEFMVQAKGEKMDVEKSTKEWSERESPFLPVAKLILPQQEIPSTNDNSIEANRVCDSYSFNPGHSLAAHKPLGALNRLRKVIYEHISKVRHNINNEPRREP